MSSDPFAQYKAVQREGWALFAPLEVITIQPAGLLVEFAGVGKKHRVLDVGCGTGVVAVTAARQGAEVHGLDLSPVLLEHAKANASLAQVEVQFREGDAEQLPFKDAEFDFVLSQFGHMFAPRPEVAMSEMLRVLKPGGTIAFSTWPPELFTGKMFRLVSSYLPPPEGVVSPVLWGEPEVILKRFGDQVQNVLFDRPVLRKAALSVHHAMNLFETTAAPVIKLREKYEKEDPAKLEKFRAEFAELIRSYMKLNTLYQHFLMTRAVKK